MKVAEVTLGLKTSDGNVLLEANTIDSVFQRMKDLTLNNEHELVEIRPKLLIGIDSFWKLIISTETLPTGLTKVHTKLGSLLCGKLNKPRLIGARPEHTLVARAANKSITDAWDFQEIPPIEPTDVSEFWSLEAIGIHDHPSEDDDQVP